MQAESQAAPCLVLIVDDEEAGLFVKSQTMRRAGFEVVQATTGAEAQEIVKARAPDLILLDVNLPDISGFRLSGILKALSTHPAPQILQISNTSITTADRVKSLSSGADAYLAEPVDADVLMATVSALLRVRRVELELAQALDRERAAREEAERANRLKDEFLAGLSHELRTPLNAIMGWIWQLRHSTLSEQGRERALASLERNTRLQVQLVNDLLDVSRLSRGKMQLALRVVDVDEIVDAAADSVRQEALDKKLVLSVAAQPVLVCVDAVRLQQVVTNLLSNAVHFTPTGGTIDLTMEQRDSSLTINVHDSGAGIAEAFLPFVFDKFRQADTGATRQHGGLGVGLSIVKEIAELHGGVVSAASEGKGRGATFSVQLPIADAAVIALQKHAGEAPILTGLRVLLVEDTSLDGPQVTGMLTASGAVVQRAAAGQDAIDAVARGEFDVVVGDVDAGSRAAVPSRAIMPPASSPGDASAEDGYPVVKPGRLIAAIAHAFIN